MTYLNDMCANREVAISIDTKIFIGKDLLSTKIKIYFLNKDRCRRIFGHTS